MDLTGVEPMIGVQTWTQAARIVETMTTKEAALAMVAFSAFLAEREAHGGLLQDDDIYAFRSAVRIAGQVTSLVKKSAAERDRQSSPWLNDQSEDEPPF